MSGGSYNYLYSQVRDAAGEVRIRTLPAEGEEARRWFADHLELVAQAMHDIEWVDSCDYGPGDEIQAIEAVRKHAHPDGIGEKARERLELLAAEILRAARAP